MDFTNMTCAQLETLEAKVHKEREISKRNKIVDAFIKKCKIPPDELVKIIQKTKQIPTLHSRIVLTHKFPYTQHHINNIKCNINSKYLLHCMLNESSEGGRNFCKTFFYHDLLASMQFNYENPNKYSDYIEPPPLTNMNDVEEFWSYAENPKHIAHIPDFQTFYKVL